MAKTPAAAVHIESVPEGITGAPHQPVGAKSAGEICLVCEWNFGGGEKPDCFRES